MVQVCGETSQSRSYTERREERERERGEREGERDSRHLTTLHTPPGREEEEQ